MKFSTRNLIANTSLWLLAGTLGLQAAGNDVWTGAAGDNNWATAGNWSGANTPPIAGDTPVFGAAGAGGLTLNNDLAADTSFLGLTFTSGAPAFILNGNRIDSTGGIVDNTLNPQTIGLDIIFASSHTLNATAGGLMTIGGAISGAGGATKTGAGTVVFKGANVYTGTTTVSAGTLKLDFDAAGAAGTIIGSSSALSLGGGTLSINGSSTAASSQTFAGTSLSGANAIALAVPTGQTVALTLGAIAQTSVGTTLAILPTGAGTLTISGTAGTAVSASATTPIASTTAGYVSGAFVTYGQADYAAISSGSVIALAAANYTANAGPNVEVGSTGYTTPSTTTSVNVMRFNTAGAASVVNKTVYTTGGILVTPNVGVNNVSITSSGATHSLQPNRSSTSGSESVIWQNNLSGYLIFTGANTLDNGKTGAATWVQAGPGTVQYNQNAGSLDGFTGSMYLNGGYTLVSANGNGVFGAQATAAAVNLNGGTLVAGYTFTLDNSGVNPRPVGLLNAGGTLAAVAGATLTVDGVVSGAGALTIGTGTLPGSGSGTANSTAVIGSGTVILNNGANTYSGGTVLAAGQLQFTSGSLGTGGVTFNGGTLQWGSSTATDISAQTVTVKAGGGTLDVNGNGVTLANAFGNYGSGALTLKSTLANGSLTVAGAGTYTGATTVSSGTLKVNGTLASSGVTVASGATLGGSGTLAGTVDWQAGSSALFTPGSPLTAGVVTLNGNAVIVNVPGSSPLGVGSYTLLNYTAAGSTGTFATGAPTYTGAGVAAGTISSISTSGGTVTLTVAASGVSAAWNTDSDGNWSDATKWSSNPTVPGVAGDSATFGTGTALRTVALDANETVGGLVWNNANSFVIASSGNTLTLDNTGSGALISVTDGTANAINTAVALNDNATVSVSSGKALVVAGVVANTGSARTLNLNGAGTTVLAAANTYGPTAGSAGTTLNGGGTVQVGNNNALSTGDVNVAGSSKIKAGTAGLNLANNIAVTGGAVTTVDNNAYDLTLSGVISGGGSLSKISSGTLTLNGANTYSGGTTVTAGTLSLLADGNLGAVPGSATPNNLVLNNGSLLAGGTMVLSANRGLGLGATSGSATSTTLLDVVSGQTLTINGIMASAGNTGVNNLTVNSVAASPGTVVLGGANTFSGTTLISAGALQLANALALQNSVLNYVSGTLSFDTTLTAATIGQLTGSQNLVLNNAAGTPAAVALTTGGNNATWTYGASLSGLGSLTKAGTGTLTLTGNHSYAGSTTVNAGVVQLDPGGVIAGAAANVSAVAGARLVVNGGTLTATSGSVANNSSGLLVSAGSASFSGDVGMSHGVTGGGLISVTGGSLSVSNLYLGRTGLNNSSQPAAGATGEGLYINGGSVMVVSNLDMSANTLDNSSVNARIDSGSLTVGGTLTVGLNNGGRWSALDVNGGTLTVNDTGTGISLGGPFAGNAILLLRAGTATAGKISLGYGTIADTAVVSLAGGSLYVGSGGIAQVSANVTPSVLLTSGTLGASADWSSSLAMTLGGAVIQAADASSMAHNITLNGVLSGTTLSKTGLGKLTLGGANTYTGNTTISAGTLALNGTASLASPLISIAGGATLDVSGLTGGFTLGGSQTVSNNAAAVGVLNGNASTGSGTVSLSYAAGTPALTVTNGTLTLAGTTTFRVNNAGAALAAGGYKLIAVAPAGAPGVVAGTLPTVTVTGGGLAAGAVGTLALVNNELYLVVNHAPVVTTPIELGAQSGVLQTLQVVGGKYVTDADGDTLTISAVSYTSGNGATVTINGNNVEYTAAGGYTGADSFGFTVSDGHGGTATGVVNVVVSPVATPQAPTIVVGAGSTTVSFWGVPGVSYTIQRAPAVTGPWTDLGPATANAANVQPVGRIHFTDPAPLGGSGYYRLKP